MITYMKVNSKMNPLKPISIFQIQQRLRFATHASPLNPSLNPKAKVF